MAVAVRTLQGAEHTVALYTDDTLLQLKKRVKEAIGIRRGAIQLVVEATATKLASDSKLLSDLAVEDGTVLSAVGVGVREFRNVIYADADADAHLTLEDDGSVQLSVGGRQGYGMWAGTFGRIGCDEHSGAPDVGTRCGCGRQAYREWLTPTLADRQRMVRSLTGTFDADDFELTLSLPDSTELRFSRSSPETLTQIGTAEIHFDEGPCRVFKELKLARQALSTMEFRMSRRESAKY